MFSNSRVNKALSANAQKQKYWDKLSEEQRLMY